MALLDLFKKAKFSTIKREDESQTSDAPEKEVPDGMYVKCKSCSKAVLTEKLKNNLFVCPECGAHLRMGSRDRIDITFDEFSEMFTHLQTENPLDFKGYPEKIAALKEKTGLDEAVVTGVGKIGDFRVAAAVMDSNFLMASMGSVVGEKLTRIIEYAAEKALPLVIFACSGGARMQEGIISLMQMAKVSAALTKLDSAGQLYITVLTDPTTGGVTASFAMLGDIIVSEPGAIVGFAGRRVIEGTIGTTLPEGFQSAEFVLEHGYIDMISERKNLKGVLCKLLKLHVTGGNV